MASRRVLKRIARMALAGLLFAQAALAIAACELGVPSAAQAIVNANAAGSQPCHQQTDESAAMLCVAHCVTQSQSLEKPFGKLPAPVPVLVVVSFAAPAMLAPSVPLSELPLALAGPPRRILFRSLLI